MKTQNKIYTIVIIFVLIILFLIVFLIYPTLKDIKNGSKEILSNKNRAVLINEEIKELDNFKKNYDDYKPNLEKIDQLFIDSQNPIDFIKFLEGISFDSSIVSGINLVSLAGNETIDSLPVVLFQISAKGDILNILKFIEKLERGPYLIRIKNLTIKKSAQDNIKDGNIYNEVDANFSIEVVTK